MKKHLIIGNPLEHSLSPKIHNYWLKKNNISDIWSSKSDTYKYPKRFFSYRYSVHKGYKDYGRMLSLILK